MLQLQTGSLLPMFDVLFNCHLIFSARATYGVENEDGEMFTVKVPRVMLESRKDKEDFPNVSPPVGMV